MANDSHMVYNHGDIVQFICYLPLFTVKLQAICWVGGGGTQLVNEGVAEVAKQARYLF